MRIGSLGLAPVAAPAAGGKKGQAGFEELFMKALGQVNDLQLAAGQEVRQALAGKADLVQVVTATDKANLALELTVQVRNKLLTAYNQVMQMQL